MIKRNEKKKKEEERSSSEYFVYIFGMLHVLHGNEENFFYKQTGKMQSIFFFSHCIIFIGFMTWSTNSIYLNTLISTKKYFLYNDDRQLPVYGARMSLKDERCEQNFVFVQASSKCNFQSILLCRWNVTLRRQRLCCISMT